MQNELSDEQREAIDAIKSHLEQGKVVIALAGPAGSGKTTLISQLQQEVDDSVVISAMTNKAASVLRDKGLVTAVTAYQACLKPLFEPPGTELIKYLKIDEPEDCEEEVTLLKYFSKAALEQAVSIAKQFGLPPALRSLGIEDFFAEYFSGWGAREERTGLLVIDEASMLGGKLLETIRKSFSQILLVGDEYQLPPVGDTPVFWDDTSVDHRVRITQVHRQAANSQSLSLANEIKSGDFITLTPVEKISLPLCRRGIPIIVGRNDTRVSLTKRIRYEMGYIGGYPDVGEILVCRQTEKIEGIDFVNNSMWRVVETDGGNKCRLRNLDEHGPKKPIDTHMEEYNLGTGIHFRYAYALTCHSAQGSEWPTVMIHAKDARWQLGMNRENGLKWLYTSVTRSRDRVVWVSDEIE